MILNVSTCSHSSLPCLSCSLLLLASFMCLASLAFVTYPLVCCLQGLCCKLYLTNFLAFSVILHHCIFFIIVYSSSLYILHNHPHCPLSLIVSFLPSNALFCVCVPSILLILLTLSFISIAESCLTSVCLLYL